MVGGEFNVAVSLANYGMTADYVTKIPNNELGISKRKCVA
jgi:2-dehydro-3-deoxygluconokinase